MISIFLQVDKAFKILMSASKKQKEQDDVAEGVIIDHPDIKVNLD